MATGAVFPAFIRATYEETSDGVPAFERAMQASVNRARKSAEVSMDDMYREVSRAVSGGKSDLGASDMRAAASAASTRAQAARQVANALTATAAAEADYSLATQASIAAARRLADEEEHAARAAGLNAVAIDRMAEAARRSNIDLGAVLSASTATTRSVGAHRQAQMMLGQQLQDTAIQLQLGMNPLMILTQQGSQAAFAMQSLGGKAAMVGRFLSNPWVAALAVAGTAIMAFAGESEEVASALDKVKFSSNAVGDAQNILGGVMDLATGKINSQSSALLNLARAQLAVATIGAKTRMADARTQMNEAGTLGLKDGLYGIFASNKTLVGSRVTTDIVGSLQAGATDGKSTLRSLKEFNKAGLITDQVFTKAASAVANFGVEADNIKTLEAAERVFEGLGTTLDKRLLLKPARAPREKRQPRAANDNVMEWIRDTRWEAQGNAGKLAADMIERQQNWGKDEVSLTDRMIEQGKELAALEQARADGAQQITDSYLRQLDALTRMRGPIGSVSGIVEGIVSGGNFGAIGGKAGAALNALAPMVGEQGWKGITKKLDQIFGGEGQFEKSMTRLLQGATLGQTAGGLVFGSSNNKLGSSIGGALGDKLGDKFLSKGLEKLTGLADLGGPIGSIIGGLAGGLLGGLMKKTKYGYANISMGASGELEVGTAGGNSSSRRTVSSKTGGAVLTTLDDIAQAFGGDLTGQGNVTVGMYKKKWRVSTTGYQGKLNFNGESANGLYDFGEDQAAAIRFATLDLIKDGAIAGLREGTKTLLAMGDDLDRALQRALDFEGVFTRLKGYKDPVGAALDTLDREFKRLQDIFKDAGASTAEYAQLEELYGIERAEAIKTAGEKLTVDLKSLLNDLTVSNDARSLRVRQGEAQAAYSDLAAKVRGGDTGAYAGFADAARTLLDIERQISGSGQDYFTLLDQVQALTKGRVDAETNVAAISAGRDSLFSKDTLAPVVSATETQTAAMVAALQGTTSDQTAQIVAALNLNTVAVSQVVKQMSIPPADKPISLTAMRKNF